MKKILLLGLAIISFSLSQAQVFTIAGKDIGFVHVGPKIGFGSSFISNYTQDGQNARLFLNFQAGVVGKFGITEKLSIQPELLYTRKGANAYEDNEEFNYEGKYKTIANYIGIPILAKISFIQINDIRIHGSGGIYTNISTGQKTKTEFVYPEQTFDEGHSIEDQFYKKVDFGISIGGGAEYDIGAGLLVGELLIEHGVVDTYENDFLTKSNRHTTVSLAFTFLYDVLNFMQ